MDKVQLIRWLGGTTCQHHMRLQDHRMVLRTKGHEYWLLKHRGHTSYVDRCTGTLWCGTYYGLYKFDGGESQFNEQCFLYGHGIKTWDGRWNKTKEKEMLAWIKTDTQPRKS